MEIKIASVFGIPFYCVDLGNRSPVYPNTWLPFLGFEELSEADKKLITSTKEAIEYNLLLLKALKKPAYTFDAFLSQLTLDHEEHKRIILSNFVTTKCILISAALGGGVWDVPNFGEKLFQTIKIGHEQFFEEYSFQLVNSNLFFNSIASGICMYSDKIKKYMQQINLVLNLPVLNLGGEINALNDTQVLMSYCDKPSTLQLGQMDIKYAFSKNYPQIETTTYKYALRPKEMSGLNDDNKKNNLQIFSFIRQKYESFLDTFSNINTLSIKYKIGQYTIIFLRNGHVIGYNDPPIFLKNKTCKIFKADLYTGDKDIVVKISPLWRGDVLKSTINAGKRPFIQPTIGYYCDHNTGYAAVLSDLYTGDLYGILHNYSLSFGAVEKIFISLLRGLANIHSTPILYADKIEGKLYHSDVKLQNIFVCLNNAQGTILPENIDIFFGDFDAAAHFDINFYTKDYACPSRAKEVLDRDKMVYDQRAENNYINGRKYDIWSLGISLAELLLVMLQIKRNSEITIPFMNFIFDKFDANNNTISLSGIANIKQNEVDNEIQEIKDIINKKIKDLVERKKLHLMWDTIHSMLCVVPDERPTIFEISNRYRTEIKLCEQLSYKQTLITDYFKPVAKSRTTQESKKMCASQTCSANSNYVQNESKQKNLTQKDLLFFGFTNSNQSSCKNKNVASNNLLSMSL